MKDCYAKLDVLPTISGDIKSDTYIYILSCVYIPCCLGYHWHWENKKKGLLCSGKELSMIFWPKKGPLKVSLNDVQVNWNEVNCYMYFDDKHICDCNQPANVYLIHT